MSATRSSLPCALALAALTASALPALAVASQPTFLPLAPAHAGAAAPATVARRVVAPRIAETIAVRQPDGSIRIQCREIANPRAVGTYPLARQPQAGGQDR